MARFEKETTIKASPEAVFAYVADVERHPDWASHSLTVTKTSSGPTGAGTTYATTAKQFGTQRETLNVTEYAPNTRFAFESKGGLGLALNAFDLSPAADGSTLVKKTTDILKPTILARIMMWQIGKERPRGLEEDLARIKRHLES